MTIRLWETEEAAAEWAAQHIMGTTTIVPMISEDGRETGYAIEYADGSCQED